MSMPRLTMRSPAQKGGIFKKQPSELLHNPAFDISPNSLGQNSIVLPKELSKEQSVPYPERTEVWKLYRSVKLENGDIHFENIILARSGGIYKKITKHAPTSKVGSLKKWEFIKNCEGTPDQQRYRLMGRGWKVPERYPLSLSNYYSTEKGFYEFRFGKIPPKEKQNEEHPAYTAWLKRKKQEKLDSQAREQIQVQLSKAAQDREEQEEQQTQKQKDEAYAQYIRDLADTF